ncbi:MAG: hypothetical protein ABIK44_01355 [candidate division WOR-3 bacterium]
MRWSLLLIGVLMSCRDPWDFEPNDPTKPDPPGPPVLLYPANGELIFNYAYPQDVNFEWRPVAQANYYQFEVYSDSCLSPESLLFSNPRVLENRLKVRFNHWGGYFWRVRAASRNWNNYTDWSEPFKFILPNPAE